MYVCPHRTRNAGMPQLKDARAFTLTELLVVGLMIALVALLLAPSLQAAAGRSKALVCLDNLRSLGQAVRIYAEEYNGVLPGPLHPAVYHDVDQTENPSIQERQLLWLLRGTLGDIAADRTATCPVASDINPDSRFEDFRNMTGRFVMPTHYALNSYGSNFYDAVRATNPAYYFGSGIHSDIPGDPVAIGQVPKAEREWMIADAWYRPRVSGPTELQQEGPYQSSWTGEALPNFAPHERLTPREHSFAGANAGGTSSQRISQAKSDGITNSLFFDGHAASVPPRNYILGSWTLLYGFRGTVNPAMDNPPEGSAYWDGFWR
jgi:prepilin-type processing-associated H-X9-DG protein